MASLIKKPSAWIPIILSLVIVAVWVVGLATAGAPERQPDEGTGAHLFQIWLVLEAVMIFFFAVKWLPERPKPALVILAIQILGVLAGCAPVYYFHL